jgi:peptide/nickel transport system substrate-binding protein
MATVATRRGTWRGAAVAMAIAAALIAGGCSPVAPAKPPGFLQVDIETSPTATDPRFATDAISSRINELVFDSLVRIDRSGQFEGDLAESIERPTPTTLVFHLRHGVRFSNGRELTARDVKYTYDSILAPQSVSPRRARMAQLSSLVTPDDYTVVITTAYPYAPALEFAMQGIVPDGTPLPEHSAAAAPPGAGPFEIASYSRDEKLVLVRNPYRRAAPDSPRGIIFKIVPDPTVRALELAEGVCDVAENNIEPDVLPYLARVHAVDVDRSPGTSYQYLAFNFRDPRLRDSRVRRAIACAIDRQAIVDSLMRGTARIASGMLSPENWAYDPDVKTWPYDPVRARRLLDQAGYPAGSGGMRALSFVYKTTPDRRQLGEVLQAMLARVGIRLEIRTNEWATFYGDIQRGNFDLTSMNWVGINDPDHYYMIFDSRMTPPHGFNRGWYANPEMDGLLEQGARTLDPAARRAIYARVQQLAATDLPYVSLWWLDNVAVMNRRIAGFEPYPNGSLRSLATLTLRAPGGGAGAAQ